jgi:hypothetical protein
MPTGNENHDISFANAGVMTKKYRTSVPASAIIGGFFGKKAILEILSQDDCVGIRYYYGLDANGTDVLILVGVDANGDDLTGTNNVCKEMSILCPTMCSATNALNS